MLVSKDFLSLRSNKEEVVCRIYPAHSDIFAEFIQMIVTLSNPANSKLLAGLLKKGEEKSLVSPKWKTNITCGIFLAK